MPPPFNQHPFTVHTMNQPPFAVPPGSAKKLAGETPLASLFEEDLWKTWINDLQDQGQLPNFISDLDLNAKAPAPVHDGAHKYSSPFEVFDWTAKVSAALVDGVNRTSDPPTKDGASTQSAATPQSVENAETLSKDELVALVREFWKEEFAKS